MVYLQFTSLLKATRLRTFLRMASEVDVSVCCECEPIDTYDKQVEAFREAVRGAQWEVGGMTG